MNRFSFVTAVYAPPSDLCERGLINETMRSQKKSPLSSLKEGKKHSAFTEQWS